MSDHVPTGPRRAVAMIGGKGLILTKLKDEQREIAAEENNAHAFVGRGKTVRPGPSSPLRSRRSRDRSPLVREAYRMLWPQQQTHQSQLRAPSIQRAHVRLAPLAVTEFTRVAPNSPETWETRPSGRAFAPKNLWQWSGGGFEPRYAQRAPSQQQARLANASSWGGRRLLPDSQGCSGREAFR